MPLSEPVGYTAPKLKNERQAVRTLGLERDTSSAGEQERLREAQSLSQTANARKDFQTIGISRHKILRWKRTEHN